MSSTLYFQDIEGKQSGAALRQFMSRDFAMTADLSDGGELSHFVIAGRECQVAF